MLHHECHGAQFLSVLTNKLVKLAGLLFVDDMDLLAMGKGPESSADDVILNLQAAMLLWQKSLEVTGGSLRPDKCSWGVLAYKYKQGKPHIRTIRSLPAKVGILSPDGSMEAITRVPASEGITVVGVVQALDGKMKPQVDKLQSCTNKWAVKVQDGWMDDDMALSLLPTSSLLNVTCTG